MDNLPSYRPLVFISTQEHRFVLIATFSALSGHVLLNIFVRPVAIETTNSLADPVISSKYFL